jgi:hypothetical protein
MWAEGQADSHSLEAPQFVSPGAANIQAKIHQRGREANSTEFSIEWGESGRLGSLSAASALSDPVKQ